MVATIGAAGAGFFPGLAGAAPAPPPKIIVRLVGGGAEGVPSGGIVSSNEGSNCTVDRSSGAPPPFLGSATALIANICVF